MTLIEVVERLAELDEDSTIYAALPWTATSAAVVIPEPESGKAPHGYGYFLEVDIARQVLESLAHESSEDRCNRVIQYALHDA